MKAAPVSGVSQTTERSSAGESPPDGLRGPAWSRMESGCMRGSVAPAAVRYLRVGSGTWTAVLVATVEPAPLVAVTRQARRVPRPVAFTRRPRRQHAGGGA